jgi:hypothetical protein
LELGWVRQNAALVYLLRTGQWQPVPSSPPDCWVDRLATEFSGVSKPVAHKILATAIDAVPHPGKAAFPQPLSADEREWVLRNSAILHDLSTRASFGRFR